MIEMTLQTLLARLRDGETMFCGIDLGAGKLTDKYLDEVTFKNCHMAVDFSKSSLHNAKFIECDIKDCRFAQCDLSGAVIENCRVENIDLSGAKLDGITFNENMCYSYYLNQEDIELLK